MAQCKGNLLPHNGKWPKVSDDVFIAPGAVVIGDVEIGAGSSIWFNTVIRGDENPVRIGERVNIQDGSVVHVHSKLQGTYIGSDITIGHMALLHACNIQDNAFVGMGSVVLDGCTIESHSMLAAGAMLTPGKTVKAGELWGGRPAASMRKLSEKEIADFSVSSSAYAQRAQEYQREFKDLLGKGSALEY